MVVFFRPPQNGADTMYVLVVWYRAKKVISFDNFQNSGLERKILLGLEAKQWKIDCKVEFLKLWKSCCVKEAFLCCPFWLPRADDATTVRHRSLGHWSSKKAIRVFSRKGNYTQVSSKHARNLSLANFWISFFSLCFLMLCSNDWMVNLTVEVVVVIFYGPTIIKSIIFGFATAARP